MEEDKIGANSYVVVKTSKFALKRFASWLQHSFLASIRRVRRVIRVFYDHKMKTILE